MAGLLDQLMASVGWMPPEVGGDPFDPETHRRRRRQAVGGQSDLPLPDVASSFQPSPFDIGAPAIPGIVGVPGVGMLGGGPLGGGRLPSLLDIARGSDGQFSPFDTRAPGIPQIGMLGGGMLGGGRAPSMMDIARSAGGQVQGEPQPGPKETNDPLSSEPVVFADGVPLPRPRPEGVGTEADDTARPTEGSASRVSGAAGGATDAPLPLSPDAMSSMAAAPGGAAGAGGGGQPAADTPSPFTGVLSKIFNPANAATFLALGSGFAGAPNIGTGMRRAFGAATPTAALLRKEQVDQENQKQTYQAMIANGVPPREAIAALKDPEVKKAMIAKYFETKSPEWKQIGEDRYGTKTFGMVNAQAQTINGKPMAEYMAGQTAQPAGLPFITPGARPPTPEEVAKTKKEVEASALGGDDGSVLPENATLVQNAEADRNFEYMTQLKKEDSRIAGRVQAISDGRLPFPSAHELTKPEGRRIAEAVATFDPTYDATNFKARQNTRTDYSSGPSSRITKSVNMVIDHGYKLFKTADELGNTGSSWVNEAVNPLRNQISDKYKDARASFEANRETFVKEADYALTGGKPTVSGQNAIREAFNANSSPTAQKAYIRRMIELLDSRLVEHTAGYNRGMSTRLDPMSFISDVNRKHYLELTGRASGGEEGAAAGAPAPAAPAIPKLNAGQTTVVDGVTIKRKTD